MKSKNLIVAVAACCLISVGGFAQNKKESSKSKSLHKGTAPTEQSVQTEIQPVETNASLEEPAVVAPTTPSVPETQVKPAAANPTPVTELTPAVKPAGKSPQFKSKGVTAPAEGKK